jgi:hypothetical protein
VAVDRYSLAGHCLRCVSLAILPNAACVCNNTDDSTVGNESDGELLDIVRFESREAKKEHFQSSQSTRFAVHEPSPSFIGNGPGRGRGKGTCNVGLTIHPLS